MNILNDLRPILTSLKLVGLYYEDSSHQLLTNEISANPQKCTLRRHGEQPQTTSNEASKADTQEDQFQHGLTSYKDVFVTNVLLDSECRSESDAIPERQSIQADIHAGIKESDNETGSDSKPLEIQDHPAVSASSGPDCQRPERQNYLKVYCYAICVVLWLQFLRYLPSFWIGVEYQPGLTVQRIIGTLWFLHNALVATFLLRSLGSDRLLVELFRLWQRLEKLEHETTSLGQKSTGNVCHHDNRTSKKPGAGNKLASQQDESVKGIKQGGSAQKGATMALNKERISSCGPEKKNGDVSEPTTSKRGSMFYKSMTCCYNAKRVTDNGDKESRTCRIDRKLFAGGFFRKTRAEKPTLRKEPDETKQVLSSGMIVSVFTVAGWIWAVADLSAAALFASGLLSFDRSMIIIHTNPFGSSTPVRVVVLFLQFWDSCAFVFPVALSCSFCAILIRRFRLLNKNIAVHVSESTGRFPARLGHFRQQHLLLCDCVGTVDQLLSRLTMTSFVVKLLMTCCDLHSLLTYDNDIVGRALYCVWILETAGNLLALALAEALVHEAAHAPLDLLFKVDTWDANPGQVAQLQLFISKLTGSSIGFTVLGILTVTKQMILTLGGLFVTYFLLLLQYQALFD